MFVFKIKVSVWREPWAKKNITILFNKACN